jgi:hypothetical protein
MNDALSIFQFFQTEGLLLVFKILILVLLFVYILFAFIVVNRVRALNRSIYISSASASATLQFLTILFMLLGISLFIATIVIV